MVLRGCREGGKKEGDGRNSRKRGRGHTACHAYMQGGGVYRDPGDGAHVCGQLGVGKLPCMSHHDHGRSEVCEGPLTKVHSRAVRSPVFLAPCPSSLVPPPAAVQ